MFLPIFRSLAGYISPPHIPTIPDHDHNQAQASAIYHLDDGLWPPIPPPPPSRTVKPVYTGPLERPVPYRFAGLRRLLPRNVKTWLDGDVRAQLEGGVRQRRSTSTGSSEDSHPRECWTMQGSRCCARCGRTTTPIVTPSRRGYSPRHRHPTEREEPTSCGHISCQKNLNREVQELREQVLRLSNELRKESRKQAHLSSTTKRIRKKTSSLSRSSEGTTAVGRKRKPRTGRTRVKKMPSSSSFLSSSEASGSGYRPPSPFLTRGDLGYHLVSRGMTGPRMRTPPLSTSSFSPPSSPSPLTGTEVDVVIPHGYAKARLLYPSPESLSRSPTPYPSSPEVGMYLNPSFFAAELQGWNIPQTRLVENANYPAEQDMEAYEDIDDIARSLNGPEGRLPFR